MNLIYADDILVSQETTCTFHALGTHSSARSIDSCSDGLFNTAEDEFKKEVQGKSMRRGIDDYLTGETKKEVEDNNTSEDTACDTSSVLSEYSDGAYSEFMSSESTFSSTDSQNDEVLEMKLDDCSNYIPGAILIQKKFRKRKAILKNLKKRMGKKSLVSRFLSSDEKYAAAFCLHEAHPDDFDVCHHSALLPRLKRWIQFDFHFSLPGLAAIILYGICHICLYEVCALLYNHYDNAFQSIPVHYVAIFVGLFLTRLSGAVWFWLGEARYECARFAFHNKVLHRDTDVNSQRWFKKHEKVQLAIELVGFFLIYLGLNQFIHYSILPVACDIEHNLLSQLPSLRHSDNDASSYIQELFEDRDKELLRIPNTVLKTQSMESTIGDLNFEDDCDTEIMCCDDTESFDKADLVHVYEVLAESSFYEFMGYEGAPLYNLQCSASLHGSLGILSVISLEVLGVNFWR